jgi:hypothetical protein
LSAIELAQIAETQLGLSNITIFLFTTAVQISGAIITNNDCLKNYQICNNIWKQYAFVRSYGCGLLQPKDN